MSPARALPDRASHVCLSPGVLWSVEHLTGGSVFHEFPLDVESMESLFRRADTALYHSKESGRNSVSYCDEEGSCCQWSPQQNAR